MAQGSDSRSSAFGIADIDTNYWPARLVCIEGKWRGKSFKSYQATDAQGRVLSIQERSTTKEVYYGGKSCPKYAILSYTWGRYRADGKWGTVDNPKAEAIEIKSISWEVPRIDPETGFTAAKFKDLLLFIADDSNCQFVWVDVGCIDQEPPATAPDNDEVGKQVSIFSKATKAYIWLHGAEKGKEKNEVSMEDNFVTFINLARPAASTQQDLDGMNNLSLEEKHKAERDVPALFIDGYFSSLWTLQEGFLRKDALILTNRGKTIPVAWGQSGRSGKQDLDLNTLLDICATYMNQDGTDRNALIDMALTRGGLDSLCATNPMILLRAAPQRQISQGKGNRDRIIGIQQIFNVHIGDGSLPNISDELALSIKMNERCPALSQIFYHPPSQFRVQGGGQSWQNYLGTNVPDQLYVNHEPNYIEKALGARRGTRAGRVVRGIETKLCVPEHFFNAQLVPSSLNAQFKFQDSCLRFRGKSLSVTDLRERWGRTESNRIPVHYPGPFQTYEAQRAADAEGSDPPEQQLNSFTCSVWTDYTAKLLGPKFVRVICEMDNVCRMKEETRVLILGRIRDSPNPFLSSTSSTEGRDEAWVGLLVRPASRESRTWVRVGFCTWKDDISSCRSFSDQEYLLS